MSLSSANRYPEGLDPFLARQNLLHHAYSPLITVQSSLNSDLLIQSILDTKDLSLLQILKPYGNNTKYGSSNQLFRIVNSQLITKSFASFPVRFEPSLPDLISFDEASSGRTTNQLNQLFSISSLELLLKSEAEKSNNDDNIYLDFFCKVISSNKIVPFETFNHPISQIFVIDYDNDSIQDLRQMIVEFRNSQFPKFFQIDDLMIHAFVFFDNTKTSTSDIADFQNEIKNTLSITSTLIPIGDISLGSKVSLPLNENSTIEEDLQRLSLKIALDTVDVPSSLDTIFRNRIFDFISKYLIPHMQQRIRSWDDQFLQPRRSITNKFFSASKRLFNNETNSSSSFDHKGSYYYKSSPEQIIRKLADWSLMLNDFKYAYSTYDLIKRDYTNDKAWAYVASSQEMCITSLLLAQTQHTSNMTPPDKATLRKIRHDIVEPFIDNLSYTFKSRLNLKTYSIRTLLVTVELLLSMSFTFNISWWWNDLIEKYLCKTINEFDIHLTSRNQNSQVIRALLYERLGYSSGRLIYLTEENKSLLNLETPKDIKVEPVDDGLYYNVHKISVPQNNSFAGLTRYRHSSIWYLLAIKEWLILNHGDQAKKLLDNIKYSFNTDLITKDWYDRDDVLLGSIKRTLASELRLDDENQ